MPATRFTPLFLLLLAPPLISQQRVPTNNGTPVAPNGLGVTPPPSAPVTYKTAEGRDIRVVPMVRGLSSPWSMVFLPDGSMLVTERPGRLRLIRNGVLNPQPVTGVPAVRSQGLCGLFDVALHPRFAQNQFVYLTYDKTDG
jgi:glucose/arabinose dehydrogenase